MLKSKRKNKQKKNNNNNKKQQLQKNKTKLCDLLTGKGAKSKVKCRDPGLFRAHASSPDLNQGPSDLQSDALPTELSRQSRRFGLRRHLSCGYIFRNFTVLNYRLWQAMGSCFGLKQAWAISMLGTV